MNKKIPAEPQYDSSSPQARQAFISASTKNRARTQSLHRQIPTKSLVPALNRKALKLPQISWDYRFGYSVHVRVLCKITPFSKRCRPPMGDQMADSSLQAWSSFATNISMVSMSLTSHLLCWHGPHPSMHHAMHHSHENGPRALIAVPMRISEVKRVPLGHTAHVSRQHRWCSFLTNKCASADHKLVVVTMPNCIYSSQCSSIRKLIGLPTLEIGPLPPTYKVAVF
jgi:hypothetical protein|mmetsp:Transcript_38355/g.63721  ORF Transcript_38355/g.63721 Transcript_38355/m.63721 type:complete len:226 (+) Transcript_38355:56-733(+)